MSISASMGLSLLVTAWLFYRITGALALWLVGAISSFRAITLTAAQIVGGIAGAALVAGITPQGGIDTVVTTLQTDMNVAQGLFLEAFLTAALVFAVLMLAAEKHRATYLAPVGIGLTLFVGQLFGTLWTGCGMNPARAFGPSVVSGIFPSYHWIYWIGPLIGSLISVFIYTLLKAFDYGSVVLGQDSDDASNAPKPIHARLWEAGFGFTRHQREGMLATGMPASDIDRVERGMVDHVSRTSSIAHAVGEARANGIAHEGGPMSGPASTEKTLRPSGNPRNQSHRSYVADPERASDLTMDARGQQSGGIQAPSTHAGILDFLHRNKGQL